MRRLLLAPLLASFLPAAALQAAGPAPEAVAPASSAWPTVLLVDDDPFMLAVLAFVWFWPIWTDVLLTKSEWDARIWLRRWI